MKTIIVLAYLDPGVGALVLQWFIMGGMAMAVLFRKAIVRPLKLLFGKKHPSNDEDSPDGFGKSDLTGD